MMKRTSKELIQVQVGAFLVFGILLGMIAIFVLGSKSSFFIDYYTLYCDFDNISGLSVGSPIELAGVRVGNVEEISFIEVAEKDKGEPIKTIKVRVKLSIDKKFQDRIRTDSVASVVTQGLLGDRMIFISAGVSPNVLKDSDKIIEVRDPAGFSSLVQQGDALLTDAKDLVQNVNKIAEEIVEGEGLIHQLVFDKTTAQDVNQVAGIIDNIYKTSGHFLSISKKIEEGRGTLGGLISDDSLYNDLKSLFGKASRNKLLRSVIRYTLQTRENEQLKSPE